MRIYQNFKEALSEVKRDVVEMGIRNHPKTYQDKYIADDENFATLEVQNYIYTVVKPLLTDLNPDQPWADAEFVERINPIPGNTNPGEAWKLREDVWKQFLTEGGTFGYSYGERMNAHDGLEAIVERLNEDPDSRQCFLSVWEPEDVNYLGGISRVPCTLGYQFQIRRGQLNITYLQRSSDVVTHFTNDVYLAAKLQEYVASRCGIMVGNYTHWIGSLHIFRKDAEGVF